MFGWFRKKDKTPLPAAEATPAIEYLSIQEDLAALMRGHGLDVQSHDDWLLVGNDVPLLRGTYNIDNRTGDSITTQIDIELRLSAERSIYEHYAGVDRDERQSMGQGLFKFCCGAFHVFLSAFWNHHEPDQVEIERWTIGGASWDVYIGNMINNATDDQDVSIPRDYLTTAQAAICALSLTPEDHWLSFYAANLKGELTTEARFDNDVWPALGQGIADLRWVPAEGFYSTRNFILLRPAKS